MDEIFKPFFTRMVNLPKNDENANVVEPTIPTFCGYCGQLVKVTEFRDSDLHPMKVQKLDGSSILATPNETSAPFTTLPSAHDTIPDVNAYISLWQNNFDVEKTIQQFHAWGLTKVYMEGTRDCVMNIDVFLHRVSVKYPNVDLHNQIFGYIHANMIQKLQLYISA